MSDWSDDDLWSPEAEHSALGCLFLDGAAPRVIELVPVDALWADDHRAILRAARKIHARGEVIDVVTLSDQLKADGKLEAAGDMGYLAQLVDAVPSAANLETWAETIQQKAFAREYRAALVEQAQALATAAGGDVQEIVDRGEEQRRDIRKVHEPAEKEDERRIYMLRELQEDPDLIREPEPLVTGVLYPGFCTMIAGREKLGKSTVAFAAVAAVCRGEDPFAQDDR